LLTPLGSSSIQIEPVRPENEQKQPTPWGSPTTTIVAPLDKSNQVRVDSLLSANSREEHASTFPNTIHDHKAENLSHGLKALNIELIETSLSVTTSPLSADAKKIQPFSTLNADAQIYDPFGNIVECESPITTRDLDAWREILNVDGILNNNFDGTHKTNGLTVDTSEDWTTESTYHPSNTVRLG
jgi:hypothetical protein